MRSGMRHGLKARYPRCAERRARPRLRVCRLGQYERYSILRVIHDDLRRPQETPDLIFVHDLLCNIHPKGLVALETVLENLHRHVPK